MAKADEVLRPRRVALVSRVLIGLGTSCAYPTATLLIRRRAREAGLDKPQGGVPGGSHIAETGTAAGGAPPRSLPVALRAPRPP